MCCCGASSDESDIELQDVGLGAPLGPAPGPAPAPPPAPAPAAASAPVPAPAPAPALPNGGLSEEEMAAEVAEIYFAGYMIPSDEQITRYRAIGAQLQTWIEDPNAPGCTVAEATLRMNQLIHNSNPADNWNVVENSAVSYVADLREDERRMMGLPSADNGELNFRHLQLDKVGTDETLPNRNRQPLWNNYTMTIGKGFIACHSMFRWDGPMWNEMARAFYEYDFAMPTLKYVCIMNIINEQTAPLVKGVLYPRRGIRFSTMANDQPHLVWAHGTPEYQEILGTAIGKAVCYLLLSSFSRGTRRISRILTWGVRGTNMYMLFEIEDTTRRAQSCHIA
jgi:hypothetical protein